MIGSLFKNVLSISLALTSNLVFLYDYVHSLRLFRVKIQLAQDNRNQNTIEHNEKHEVLE